MICIEIKLLDLNKDFKGVAGQKFSTKGMSDELIAKLNGIPEREHQIWILKATGKMDAGIPIVRTYLARAWNTILTW